MSQLQAVVIFVFIVFGLAFYFILDLKVRSEALASPKDAARDGSPAAPTEHVCVDCAKDTASRLERAAEEAFAILAKLEQAEEKRDGSVAAAVTSAILKYETDIRRLRDLAATQQRSIDRLNDLSRRDYKADVEAGVFEHLAALARDRANALADKKEL